MGNYFLHSCRICLFWFLLLKCMYPDDPGKEKNTETRTRWGVGRRQWKKNMSSRKLCPIIEMSLLRVILFTIMDFTSISQLSAMKSVFGVIVYELVHRDLKNKKNLFIKTNGASWHFYCYFGPLNLSSINLPQVPHVKCVTKHLQSFFNCWYFGFYNQNNFADKLNGEFIYSYLK